MNTSSPNPLLKHLPIYKDPAQLMDAITYHPLDQIDVAKLDLMEKDMLLVGEKVIFHPTKKALQTTMTWLGMLTASLRSRNPVITENKRRHFESLSNQNVATLDNNAPTRGMSVNLIKGPAGTGKTTIIQRFCACLPQIVNHGECSDAGWLCHTQLVYLNIDIPHSGARSGLIQAILVAMDNALGTQYATTLPRQNRTVDKLAIATYQRLIAHHTGIIFIDESQLRNLVMSGQADLVQLFLLQLMNLGIPLVISGNEKAFDWLTYSQDLTRLALTPTVHFHPIGALLDEEENDWRALAKGIMQFYVLSQPIIDEPLCSKTLKECSGGIARLALTLWSQAQHNCLWQGREAITANDILQVYMSHSYAKLKPFADGFRYKNAKILASFPDVDAEFYGRYWKHTDSTSSDRMCSASSSSEDTELEPSSKSRSPRSRTEKAKLKAKKTAAENKALKAAQKQQTLDPDDMRVKGFINHNLDQLNKLSNAT